MPYLLLVLLWALLPAAVAAEDGHVGQDTCRGCHAEVADGYAHTVHARALTPENARTAAMARGCEGCHGPGAAHAGSAGRDAGPGWLSFSEQGAAARERQEEACLQCHRGDKLRLWHASAHDSRDVSCTACHTVMKPVSERHLLSQPDEEAVCRQCHHLASAQLMRSSHKPARSGPAGMGREGFMSCGSCHNSHGSVADALISAHTVNDNCYSCHADKRGPFLWEHAPVSEDCLSCHVAHGSLKPNMLRVSAPRLCQTCHIGTLHPSEARLPESRFVVGSSCMQCHPQVHGSNHPSGVFLTR